MTSRILLSFRSGSYVTVDRLGSSFNCVPTNKPQTKTPWNIAVSNSGTIAILFDATLHIYVGDAQRSLTLDAPFSSSRQRLVAWTQSGHLHLVIVNSLDGNFLVVNDRSEIKSCGDIRQYLSSFSPIIGIHALADSRILVVLEDCSVVAIQFSQDWSCVQSTTVLKWIKEDYKCEYSILLRIKSILLLATSAIQNGLKDSQSIRFDCVNLRWNEDIPSLSRFLHKEVVRPIITSLPDTPSMSSTSSLFFSKLVQRYLPTESSSYAVPILGVSCNRLESSIAVLFGNNTFWLFRLDEDALLFEESRFNLYPINSQDVITSLNFLSSDCLLALTESGSSLLYKITCSSTPSIESIQARALPPPLGLNQAVCVNDTLSILRYIDDSTYNVFSMRIVEPMDSIVQSIKRRQLEEALELAAFAGISECDVYKEVCRVWLLEQKEQERSFAYVLERITDDSFVVCFALELGISVSFAINEQLVLLNDALNRILRQAKRDYTSYIKTCALLLKQRKLLCMQKTVQAISAKSMVARFGTHSPSRNRDLESMLDNVTGVEETFGPGVDSCSEFELFARCLSSMMGDVADSDLCVMGSDGWEHHVGRLLQSAHPFEILSSFIRLEWPQDFMVNLQIYAPLVGTVLFPLDVFHQLLAFQPRALNPNVYLPLLDKIFLDRQLLSWTSLHVEALNVVSERASDWLEGVEDWPADMQMQKCCFSRKVFQSLSMQPAAQYFDLLLRLAGALLEAGLEVWCLTVLGHILDVVHHNCEEHAGSQLSDIQEWTTLLGDYCTLLSKGAIPSAISFVSWTFEGKTDLIVVPIVQAIMEQLRACSCIESDAVFQLKALRNARVERHASRSLRRFLGLQLRLEWEEVALGVEHFEEAIISSILSSIDHNVHEHLVLIATLVQDWMDFAQVGSENSGPVFGSVRGILSLLVLGCLVFDDVLLAAKIVLPIFDQLEEVAEECSLRSDQNLTLLESALTLRSILLAGCVLRHYRIPSLRFVLIAKFWTNSLGQLLDPSIAMLKSIQRSLQNPSKLVMESYKRKLARSSKFIARQLFELLNLNKSNSRVLEWSAHNAISLTDGADGDDDKRIINEIGDNLTLLELIVLQMSASFVEDNKIATVSSFLPLMTMSDHVVIVSRNLLRCKQSLADSDAPKFMAYSLLISIAATCKLDTLRNLLLRFQFGIELDGDQQAENNALAQLCDNLLRIGADKEIVRRAMHYNLRGRLFGSSSLSLEEIDLFESCLDMLNAAGCDEYWNRLIARDLSILKLFRFLQQHRVPFTPHHLNLLDPVGLNGFVLTSASNILNLISGGLRNVNPSECRESVLGYVMMMSRCAIDTSDMVAAEIEILGSLITNAIRVESVDMAYVLSCILLNEYNIDEFRAFDSVFRVIALAISFLHEQNLELLARMNARESSTVVAAHEEQFALWERLCSLYVSKCAAGHLETLMGKLTAYRRLEWSDGGNEGLDLINRGVSIILEALQSSSDEGCYSSVDLHDLQYYHHEALCYFIQSSVFNMGDMNPLESARAKLLKLESELRQQLELDGAGAVESQCVRVDENVNSPSIPANQRSEILKRLAKRGYDEIIAKQSLSLALRNVQSFSLDSIFEKALLHAIELSSSTVFDLPVIDSSNNQPIFALSSSNAIAKRLRLEQCSQLVVSLEQSVEALLGGECNAQSAEAPVACDECIAQVLDAVATGDGDSAAPGVAPSGVNDEVLDAWSDDDLDAALEDSESGGLDAVIHDDPVEPDEVQPPQVQSDFPFSSGSKEYALYALLQDINDYLEISLPGESLASQLVVFELESQVDCRGDCLSIMCKVFELLELDLERVDDEDAFDFLVDHVVPGLMLVPKILEALSRKIALERFPTSKDQDPTLVSVVAPFLRSGGTLVAAEDLLFLLSAWRLDVIGQGHNNHAALSRRPLELMLSDPPRLLSLLCTFYLQSSGSSLKRLLLIKEWALEVLSENVVMQHKESLTTWVRDNCYRTSDCSVAIVDFDVILKYLAEDILALKRMDRIFSGSKMGSAITSLFDAKRIFGSEGLIRVASPERSRRESMGLIAPFLTQDNVLHWYTAVTKHAPLTKSEIFALLWLRTLFEYSRAVKLEDRMNAFVVLRKELGHSWSKVKDDACRIALMAAVVGLPVANIAVAASTDFVVPEEYQRPTLDLEERYQILSGFCEEYGCPTGKLSVDCFIGDNPNDELVPRALKQLMGLLTSWLDVHECFPTIPYEPLDKANIVNLLRSTIADESVSDEAIKSVYRLVQWEETVLHGCGTDGLDWDYRMAIQEIIANSAAVDLCNRLSATLNRAQSQLSQTSVLSLVDAAWPELCHRAISTATRDNLSAVFSACSIISTSLQAVNADLLLSSRWDILAFLLSSALLMVDSHANSAASLLVNTLHRVELGEYELDFEGAVSDFKECDPVTVAKLSIFILGWRCGSRPSLGLGPCDALDEFFGVVVKECLSQSIARTAPVGDGSLIKQYLSGCISCRDALRDVLPDQSLLILKPFSIATLVQVVKSLLELRNFQSALVVLLVVIPLAVAVDPSRVLDPNIDNQLDALHQLTEHEDGLEAEILSSVCDSAQGTGDVAALLERLQLHCVECGVNSVDWSGAFRSFCLVVCNPISWMRRMPLYSTHILKEMFPIDGAASLDQCGMEWILVPASNENGLLSCKSCSVLDVACVLVRSGYAMEAAVLLWKARELSPEFFAVHTALKRFRREVLSVSNAAARVPHGSGWRELLNTVEHVVDDIVGTAL